MVVCEEKMRSIYDYFGGPELIERGAVAAICSPYRLWQMARVKKGPCFAAGSNLTHPIAPVSSSTIWF